MKHQKSLPLLVSLFVLFLFAQISFAETGFFNTCANCDLPSFPNGSYAEGPFMSRADGGDAAVKELLRWRPDLAPGSWEPCLFLFPMPKEDQNTWGIGHQQGPWMSNAETKGCIGAVITVYYNTGKICPAGQLPFYKFAQGFQCQDLSAGKNEGQVCPVCNQSGNPIKHGTGRKIQVEDVFATPTLSLTLTYNSLLTFSLPDNKYAFGKAWSFNYGMLLWQLNSGRIVALRADGKFNHFTPPSEGNSYSADADVADSLSKIVDMNGTLVGWQYTDAQTLAVESYNSKGQLISIAAQNGQVTQLSYSVADTPKTIAPRADLLISVTDPFGRVMSFTYGANEMINSVKDPAGNIFKFAYDGPSGPTIKGVGVARNLTSLSFPDGARRIYYYNEQDNTSNSYQPNALTGIVDEKGVRYATYKYDPQGRAISSSHAGNANAYSVTYNADGSSTVKDPLGTSRNYAYTNVLSVRQVTGISGAPCPSCGPSAMSFNSNGTIRSSTDWNGNVTTYLREDPYGRQDLETSRTEASGTAQARTITTQWHPSFRLATQINELGRRTDMSYDPSGKLISKTITDTKTKASRTWSYTYNSAGQIQSVNGPRTDVTDITNYNYDSSTGQLRSSTNAAGETTQFTSYDGNGRPLSISLPNGLVATLTYTARGDLATKTLGTEKTSYDYHPTGQVAKVTAPDGSFLSYTYDDAHRLTEIQDNLGNKISYSLDPAGNRIREEVKDPQDALVRTKQRLFDNANRLIADIGGSDPQNDVTKYTYDAEGLQLTSTDPLKRSTSKFYDALKRLSSVVSPDGKTLKFERNAINQVVGVTDARNLTTTYNVDALGNRLSMTSPDTGESSFTYDAAGNILTSKDAKNRVTSYAYDVLNRPTSVTYQDGSKVTYSYVPNHVKQITDVNSNGTLTSQITYSYNQMDRLESESRSLNGKTYITQYGYDAYGRINSMTYPSGRVLEFVLDPMGRVSQISTSKDGKKSVVVSNISYLPFGGVAYFTYGNGLVFKRTFDFDGRIVGYNLGVNTFNLGLDLASRVSTLTRSPSSTPEKTYDYDPMDRISEVASSSNANFSYDFNGNMVGKTMQGVSSVLNYSNTSNQITSVDGQAYAHDEAGSLIGKGATLFSYDARGRLSEVTTKKGPVTYGFNSLGQRYAKTVNGVTTLFHYNSQAQLIAETDDKGAVRVEYIYLGTLPVAVIK